ncbi:MAG: cytochrome C [Nitrospirae bacterium]|jgi:c(7)-type cytochrome triheme protein|nr:cytochrome C [Nitrospirota bacterium]
MKRLTLILVVIASFILITSAFAGMKTYTYKDGDLGPVTFDGKLHNTKLGPGKCMECHKGNVPFAMKMPGTEGCAKITKADHVDGKFCGVCHNGTKAFDWKEGADCTKCHKKEAASAPAVEPEKK